MTDEIFVQRLSNVPESYLNTLKSRFGDSITVYNVFNASRHEGNFVVWDGEWAEDSWFHYRVSPPKWLIDNPAIDQEKWAVNYIVLMLYPAPEILAAHAGLAEIDSWKRATSEMRSDPGLTGPQQVC